MRTASELNSALSEERIWRVRECSSILYLADRSATNTVEHEIYLRSGAVLFYSHWEGFIKRAATYYLKFVSYQKVPLDEMSPFLLRLYVKQQISSFSKSQAWEKLGPTLLHQRTLSPWVEFKKQIETESNLSSRVFRQICSNIGISFANFESEANKLDDPLLKNRNAVAHGERAGDLNIASLTETKDLVIALITLFKDEIENAVTVKSYRV